LKCDSKVLNAFSALGASNTNIEEIVEPLYQFVSMLFGSKVEGIEATRWERYRHGATAETLPPTRGAFINHVKRAHYCTHLWKNSIIATPELLDPVHYGWILVEKVYIPIMTDKPAAPKAILELVKCGCKKGCISAKCSCRSNNLVCSELCSCYETCENVASLLPVVLDDSDCSDDDE
jgi:hypothetical protein